MCLFVCVCVCVRACMHVCVCVSVCLCVPGFLYISYCDLVDVATGLTPPVGNTALLLYEV